MENDRIGHSTNPVSIAFLTRPGRILYRKDIRVLEGFSMQTIDGVGHLAKGVYSLVIDYEGNSVNI